MSKGPCGCDSLEDEVDFLNDATPPDGFYSTEGSGYELGSPADVSIPRINLGMAYDRAGNVVPDQQSYSPAEEDFLNRTIESASSQSRRSTASSHGSKRSRRESWWDDGSGAADSSSGLDSTPAGANRSPRAPRAWGNDNRPSSSPAGLVPTLRNQRPALRRPGQTASLIPVPAPRSADSRYQDPSSYQNSTLDLGSSRPSRAPVDFQQQNIDDLKKYPDPRYTYIPKHKFPGKSPSGAQRRSDPTRLRRDMAGLDVSAIPVDAAIHPHRRSGVEPMVSGMMSHVCGARGPRGVERPPIRGVDQSIYKGRFACPALAGANTWLPGSPPDDDDIQVIHSPRASSNSQDDYDNDDDDLAEFEELENRCNALASPTSASKSRRSPAMADSSAKSACKPWQSPETVDLGDTTAPSRRKSANKSRRSPQTVDFCASDGSRPKSTSKAGRSPEVVDLCDGSMFDDMEQEVLGTADETGGLLPEYSRLPAGVLGDTLDISGIDAMVQQENEDVSVAVGLSVPSRVNPVFSRNSAGVSMGNSMLDGSANASAAVAASSSGRNVSATNAVNARRSLNFGQRSATPAEGSVADASASSSAAASSSNQTVTWGQTSAFIPVVPEERDVDHTFAANMAMAQEQGLSLSSPPHQLANLLFPADEGECQITAIVDSVPLEGAIVPMRPSRMTLPPSTTEQMDELAVIADNFIRSAPDRTAGTQLNVTLGTSLNVPVVDLVSPDASVDDDTPSPLTRPDPGEEGRAIGAINAGRLVSGTDFVVAPGPRTCTWIQLRGHREPAWFPGYYVSLPALDEPVTLSRTASQVLPRAWYAAHSDSFREEHQLTFRS